MSQSTVADLLKDKAQQAHTVSKRALFSIGPESAVSEAVSSMARNEISSMIVMETDEMVGLITLRELLQGLRVFYNGCRSSWDSGLYQALNSHACRRATG